MPPFRRLTIFFDRQCRKYGVKTQRNPLGALKGTEDPIKKTPRVHAARSRFGPVHFFVEVLCLAIVPRNALLWNSPNAKTLVGRTGHSIK